MQSTVPKKDGLRGVRMIVVAALLLPLLYSCLVLTTGFLQNSHEEYCVYVSASEQHFFTHERTPCHLTQKPFADFGLIMVTTTVPIQLICFLVWLVRYRRLKGEY